MRQSKGDGNCAKPSLWETASGQSRRFRGHSGGGGAVAFSLARRHIVCGSGGKSVRLLEGASGREITRFEGHSAAVRALAFSPDGRHLVSASGDRTLRLWEVASGR